MQKTKSVSVLPTRKSEEKASTASAVPLTEEEPVLIGADAKEQTLKPRSMKELRMVRAVRAPVKGAGRIRAGRGAKESITALLGATGQSTSGANTAANISLAWDVTGATDWASFIAEYDECRIQELEIWAGVSSNGAPTIVGQWAINWDPENPGNPSGLADVIVSPTRLGPYLIANNQVTWPQMVSNGGMPHMKTGPLSRATALGSTTTAALVCGSWFPTSATSAVAGYTKFSIPALGAAVTSNIQLFGMFKCEFRMRT